MFGDFNNDNNLDYVLINDELKLEMYSLYDAKFIINPQYYQTLKNNLDGF